MELTLARRGVIEITQKGQPVPDIDAVRGPIRYRLRQAPRLASDERGE